MKEKVTRVLKCIQLPFPTPLGFNNGTDRLVTGKELKANEPLPCIRAYKIVNDPGIRARLGACCTALRNLGHEFHVKAQAIAPSQEG